MIANPGCGVGRKAEQGLGCSIGNLDRNGRKDSNRLDVKWSGPSAQYCPKLIAIRLKYLDLGEWKYFPKTKLLNVIDKSCFSLLNILNGKTKKKNL